MLVPRRVLHSTRSIYNNHFDVFPKFHVLPETANSRIPGFSTSKRIILNNSLTFGEVTRWTSEKKTPVDQKNMMPASLTALKKGRTGETCGKNNSVASNGLLVKRFFANHNI